MTNYDDFRIIVDSSNEELQEIARFLQTREVVASPITVLIGGWAVHSYNPWYGSIDIDLITNARTRNSLKNHLVENRGFVRARNLDDTKRVEKFIPSGKHIIIDFGNREREDPFEGLSCSLRYDILGGRTEPRAIGDGLFIAVPQRTVLLVLKLKAAWDRNRRITTETSDDIEWERGKLRKDRADILALLDPGAGGFEVDLYWLGERLHTFSFLRGCLSEVAKDVDAVDFYGRMAHDEVERLIEQVLSLIE